MNIAICCIYLGRYEIMWDEFYESSKAHFFPTDRRHWFVFTDSDRLLNSVDKDVTFFKEKDYGWPGNTLFRFRMFSNISDKLLAYDYVFFFNANAKLIADVGEEILPAENQELTVVQHFGMIGKNPILYTYDRNRKSTAYVKWGEEGKDYIQACFFGAPSKAFADMSKELADNIQTDWQKHVVAEWHDESHLNKYIISHPYRLLPTSYAAPERFYSGGDIKVMMRDKEKYGELQSLRGQHKSLGRFLTTKTKNQMIKARSYLHLLLGR